ncbi:MAG: RraA family protein [Planctomycetaceae bacterium]|nr:RraA family protein [Planctomycetaceae bacterium]
MSADQSSNPQLQSGTLSPTVSKELSITLEMMREQLTVPLLCDALDAAGYRHQSPRLPLFPMTVPDLMLIGRVRTMLWSDMAHIDPEPYKLELTAVDSCQPNDVLVCAAGGSMRSGIWGELLTTAAGNAGCVGVIVDGAVRDVAQMARMQFPVFARGVCPYDSRDRQRVVDFDVPVELDGVRAEPGDLIAADQDGLVIVPRRIEVEIVKSAWEKAHAENQVRDAIRNGMSATTAFETFGVL